MLFWCGLILNCQAGAWTVYDLIDEKGYAVQDWMRERVLEINDVKNSIPIYLRVIHHEQGLPFQHHYDYGVVGAQLLAVRGSEYLYGMQAPPNGGKIVIREKLKRMWNKGDQIPKRGLRKIGEKKNGKPKYEWANVGTKEAKSNHNAWPLISVGDPELLCINLDKQVVPPAEKETVGAFCEVNDDDDDKNGKPDKDDERLAGEDDDLFGIRIMHPRSFPVELTWDDAVIHIYETRSKQFRGGYSARIGAGSGRHHYQGYDDELVYVEAIKPGTTLLTLTGPGGFQDKLRISVVKVVKIDMAMDGNRDGSITFEVVDRTSQTQPYAFWINNDCDSEKGDDPDGKTPNYSDKKINGIRDLEDFARLHINVAGILPLLKKSEMRLALKFRNTTGKPGINLWKAVESDGGEGYLTDAAIARKHLSQTCLGNINAGQSYTITQKFWNELPDGDQTAHLLFEGTGTGKGELMLEAIKDSNVVCEVQGVWMDLKDIKAMYERAKATPEIIEPPYNFAYPHRDPPEPNMGWVSDSSGHPFEPAWDEDTQNRSYIVFVHGWNMSYNDSINYAETMFKRLWWRGYKGRFAFFRWPTYWNSATPISPVNAYLARYNESEYIAWKSGRSLNQFVNSLPRGYTRNITAHSMGNIVVGSALQQGMIVANYALLQAAVPACCYDVRPVLNQAPRFGSLYWKSPTPDDDSDPATRALAYRGQLRNAGGNLISFFLPQDRATVRAWEFNNYQFKPYNPRGSGGYYYQTNAPSGQKLGVGFMWSVGRFVRTTHEAMAYVAKSPTKAVGAEGQTRGAIDSVVDLSFPVYGNQNGFDREHSAEFMRSIQELQTFYRELMSQLNVRQKP